jgi:hypothetical protein
MGVACVLASHGRDACVENWRLVDGNHRGRWFERISSNLIAFSSQ